MRKTFISRDLRHQSFYNADLQGARFENCDLRGCDFRRAQLQGATFKQVKLGPSLTKLMGYGAIAMGIIVLAFHAISHMIFGALGTNLQGSVGRFIVALYLCVAIATLGVFPWHQPTKLPTQSLLRRSHRQPLALLPTIAIGALLGFYYGGSTTDNNPLIAMLAATGGGLVTGILQFIYPAPNLITACLYGANTVAAYGLTFTAVSFTSAALSTQHIGIGLTWGMLSLMIFGLTLTGLTNLIQTLLATTQTQFQGANLTDTHFDNEVLGVRR